MNDTATAGQVRKQSVQDKPSGMVSTSLEGEGGDTKFNLTLQSTAAGMSTMESAGTGFGDSLTGTQATAVTSLADSMQDPTLGSSTQIRDAPSAEPTVNNVEHHSGTHRHQAGRQAVGLGHSLEFHQSAHSAGEKMQRTASRSAPESFLSPQKGSPQKGSSGTEAARTSGSGSRSLSSPEATVSSRARQRESTSSEEVSQPASRQWRERGTMRRSPSSSFSRSFEEVLSSKNLLQTSQTQKMMGMQSLSRKAGGDMASWAPATSGKSAVLAEVEEGPLQSPPAAQTPPSSQQSPPQQRGSGAGGNSPSSSGLLLVSRSMTLGNRRGNRDRSPPPKVADGSALGKSPLAAAGRSLAGGSLAASLASSASDPQLMSGAAMDRVEKVFKDRKFTRGNRSMTMLPSAGAPVGLDKHMVLDKHKPDKHLAMDKPLVVGTPHQACRPFDSQGTRREALRGLPAIDFQQYPIGAFPARNRLHGIRR